VVAGGARVVSDGLRIGAELMGAVAGLSWPEAAVHVEVLAAAWVKWIW
jgi:hypothetical protein